MPDQTCLKFLTEKLKEAGYDGLYNPNGCACLVGNLEPCGYISLVGCRPGYKVMCKPKDCTECKVDCRGWTDETWRVQQKKEG